MDVTCDRCKTRYEFDAALVSNRGTTVKCTNCGHQFKVFRPADLAALDGWVIRTVDGRELRFRAMRELQAAITGGEVSTEDVLLPGDGSEPRRLGKIEELRSFFAEPEERTQRRPRKGDTRPPPHEDDVSLVKTNVLGSGAGAAPRRQSSTPTAVVRDREGNPVPSRSGTTLPPPTGIGSEDARMASERAEREDRELEEVRPDAPTRVRGLAEPPTLKGELPASPRRPGPLPAEQPSQSKLDAVDALNDAVNAMFADASPSSGGRLASADLLDTGWDDATNPRTGTARDPRAETPSVSDEDTVGDEVNAAGAPVAAVEGPSEAPLDSIPPATPSPSAARPSILRRSEPYTDPRFTTYGPRGGRRSMVRWMIGLIGVGLLGIAGFTMVRRYMQPAAQPAASASKEDERVSRFVSEGDSRLAAGDIEAAKDLYTKASGIAEDDPRVARGLARIEVVRADLLWLHMRLLEDDAPNRARVAQDLARAVERAEKATESAAQHAPDDPSAVGFKIDILRLKGRGGEARKLVGDFSDGGVEGGRVLAALDLIESAPSYDKVIERLRAAREAEQKMGRAHAMLVYALARSGEIEQAERELAALGATNAAFALLDPLKRYVKEAAERDGDGEEAAATAEVDKKSADDIPDDFREALQRGHAARKAGDLDRAERLYRAALAKRPGNSEALAGLADIARDRGETGSAEKRYEQMLAKNPGYIPALLGLADLKWASGKRSEALELYRQVVRSAPGTDWAAHAQAQIDAAQKAPAPKPEPAPAPAPSAAKPPASADSGETPAPSAAPSSDLPPHVDVSDLPEYQ